MRHSILIADPPWKFGDALPGKGRGAVKHYLCMPIEKIMSFLRDEHINDYLEEDAVLGMWRVASMQLEALHVVRSWGFDMPTSEIVWVKTTKDDSRVRTGMGRTVRNAHEICLLCKRGKRPWSHFIRNHAVLSVLDAGCVPEEFEVRAPYCGHSVKPDAFKQRIDDLFAGQAVLELFARAQWKNWTCVGNEMPSHDAAEAVLNEHVAWGNS